MQDGIEEGMEDIMHDCPIDNDIDLSEDELGMKGKAVLENIEQKDAWEVYRRGTNTVVAMEDFVDTPIAKQIMADRAPILADLLGATRIPKSAYEFDLEKHLLRRARLPPPSSRCSKGRTPTKRLGRAFEDRRADRALAD